jgi:8-oxo-dGTP diphosphatase
VAGKRKAERKRLLVVAAFIARRGRVLLSQRRADQSFGLSWEFPGGKVEPGEDLASALVREIREELGCRIKVKEIVDLVFHAYPDFDLIMPVYRATIVAGTPRASGGRSHCLGAATTTFDLDHAAGRSAARQELSSPHYLRVAPR